MKRCLCLLLALLTALPAGCAAAPKFDLAAGEIAAAENLALLKARDFPLADGSLTFAIDGYDARECLRITVEGGRPRVEAVGEEAGGSALPLSHAQAMELFFAPWSRLRQTLPAFASGWFPLSLYVPAVDND